ncbi:MAG: hypothetical protein LBF97_07820, partial [Elusimicrobiota bacterium]|nr:hypothetical protein [Elusimicrobiota bacterium]
GNNSNDNNVKYFDFRNFQKTDILKEYARKIYEILEDLDKNLKLSKVIQYKGKNLRELISKREAQDIINQVKAVIEGMKNGKSILIDREDELLNIKVEVEATEKNINSINQMIARTVKLPLSYINGKLTTGISTTGESDELAIDRGIKYYFASIWKPIIKELFGDEISYRVNNWRRLEAISSLLPILETTTLIDEKIKEKMLEGIFE